MIDSFVPLKFSSIGPPDGAFEVYTPYAPVAAAIAHDTQRLYLALAVGLLLFYAAAVPDRGRGFAAAAPAGQ